MFSTINSLVARFSRGDFDSLTVLEKHWMWWGVGAAIVPILSFFIPALVLEYAFRSKMYRSAWIVHGGDKERQAPEPFRFLVIHASLKFGGCSILGGFALPPLVEALIGIHDYAMPSVFVFCFQAIAMLLITDCCGYWAHRILHENKWCWENIHSMHHTFKAPSALGTVYTHTVDLALTAAGPMMVSALLIKPHPLSFYAFCNLFVVGFVVDHCGFEAPWVTIMSLKFIPGFSHPRHHDNHHRYHNRGAGAKNYGIVLDVWDRVFGTISVCANNAPSKKHK